MKTKNKTKKIANLILAKLSSNLSYGLIILASVVILNCPSSSSSSGDGNMTGDENDGDENMTGDGPPPQTLQSTNKAAFGMGRLALETGDNFGISVANVGDLDGGGGTVLAVGASGDNTATRNASGAIHLFSYNASGGLIATMMGDTLKILVASGDAIAPNTSDNDNFGASIANVGDYDGDGDENSRDPDPITRNTELAKFQSRTAIAVGAPGDDTGGGTDSNRGAIHLISYNASGGRTLSTKVSSVTNPNGPTLANGDAFGTSIAKVNELNGGSGTVIAVGTPGDDAGGSNLGAIYLLSYDASGMRRDISKVAHGTAVTDGTSTTLALANDDAFGTSIANINELNGGSGTVIAVGAPGDDTGGSDSDSNRGAIHLLSFNASGTLTAISKVAHDGGDTNGPTLALANGDAFGTSIANVGDLDGGGGTVIAVGAPGDDTGGSDSESNRGAIHLLSFNAGGTLTGTMKIASGTSNGPTLADGNAFGTSIAKVNELNGGSGTVIAVGASGDNTIHLLSFK